MMPSIPNPSDTPSAKDTGADGNNAQPAPQSRVLFALTQFGLCACAVFMAVLINLPVYGFAGLAIAGVAAIAAQRAPEKRGGYWKAAWLGSLLLLPALCTTISHYGANTYHALLAGQLALTIFITGNQPGAEASKTNWNAVGIFWGFFGAAIDLAASYLQNDAGAFWIGLAAGLLLLVLCRVWFRLGAVGIQVVNTLILLLVLLPATDMVMRWRARQNMKLDPAKYYSFEAGSKNPSAHIVWSKYYSEQWNRMWHDVATNETYGGNPFRLRPDSQAWFFHSLIKINHQGFRGPDFPEHKGNAYRIVALGESTTFGCTMEPEDRPWPEILEQLIRERLHPARPVEVINAGIPAAILTGNIARLERDILPLKPDMIISYHGYNAFSLLDRSLPPVTARAGPVYEARPIQLLADLEFGFKMNRYKKEIIASTGGRAQKHIDPLDSDYAKAYRRLINITDAYGIRLALANYSMAVNSNSDPKVMDFYGLRAPAIEHTIQANMAHSEIVRELANEHPGICFVDTHPALDGKYENFHDLVHFTQPGRQKMAETFFAAIQKTLETDLARERTNQTNH